MQLDDKTAMEAFTDHITAITERDIDLFAATLSRDDLRFVGADGSILDGYENVVAAHRDWFANEDWTFDPMVVWMRETRQMALIATWVRYVEKGAERAFVLTFGLVREPQHGWKIVFDQNTPCK
jgi:ketosteroid isomerase-like protein